MTLLSLPLKIAAAVTVYMVLSRLYDLLTNLKKARKMGLPYVVHPFRLQNLIWMSMY